MDGLLALLSADGDANKGLANKMLAYLLDEPLTAAFARRLLCSDAEQISQLCLLHPGLLCCPRPPLKRETWMNVDTRAFYEPALVVVVEELIAIRAAPDGYRSRDDRRYPYHPEGK